jgi:zinc protease
MTREDLYAYYTRYYVPNNATLVVVGDVDADEAMRGVVRHFGNIPARELRRHPHTAEPPQLGERRVTVEREGTTAYLKAGFHAPAAADADFVPMLVLDAVLTGAKGINLWASFRTPPPQRSARLYHALVNSGLASSVSGGLLPTAEPFLYTISVTVTEGTSLARAEEALLVELDRTRSAGVTPAELRKAKTQLRARVVFENDSISNIAHQLGYFDTLDSWRLYPALVERIERVTLEEVAAVAAARLRPANRTMGWFQPLPPGAEPPAHTGAGAGPASS